MKTASEITSDDMAAIGFEEDAHGRFRREHVIVVLDDEVTILVGGGAWHVTFSPDAPASVVLDLVQKQSSPATA